MARSQPPKNKTFMATILIAICLCGFTAQNTNAARISEIWINTDYGPASGIEISALQDSTAHPQLIIFDASHNPNRYGLIYASFNLPEIKNRQSQWIDLQNYSFLTDTSQDYPTSLTFLLINQQAPIVPYRDNITNLSYSNSNANILDHTTIGDPTNTQNFKNHPHLNIKNGKAATLYINESDNFTDDYLIGVPDKDLILHTSGFFYTLTPGFLNLNTPIANPEPGSAGILITCGLFVLKSRKRIS